MNIKSAVQYMLIVIGVALYAITSRRQKKSNVFEISDSTMMWLEIVEIAIIVVLVVSVYYKRKNK